MTDNVLYVRKNNDDITGEDDSNIWDDSILIKAYDRAINLAKDEVAKRLSLETSSHSAASKTPTNFSNSKQSTKNNPAKKWAIGSPCRAVYSVDGIVYEAVIIKILNDNKHCMVKFIGYGNVEKVLISSLAESEGLQSQLAQQKAVELENATANGEEASDFSFESSKGARSVEERMDYDSEVPKLFRSTSSSNSPFGMMPPAPPIPPQLMAKLPENDADALSSMLMSWYISGFHTGFYHGMKQAQDNEEKKRHSRKC